MIGTVYAQQNLENLYTPGEKLGGSAAQIATLLSPIILFAGFTYITGGGDKNKVAQASNMLSYGILGLVLVVAAYLITRIIGAVVGFDFLKQTV